VVGSINGARLLGARELDDNENGKRLKHRFSRIGADCLNFPENRALNKSPDARVNNGGRGYAKTRDLEIRGWRLLTAKLHDQTRKRKDTK
jgi:hypothetical protein